MNLYRSIVELFFILAGSSSINAGRIQHGEAGERARAQETEGNVSPLFSNFVLCWITELTKYVNDSGPKKASGSTYS